MEERSIPHINTLHPPEKNAITTVAILPFQNTSDIQGSEETLRKSFFTNLSLKGYDLLRPNEVDARLRLASIDLSQLNQESVYKIGRIVKADALIYGTITKCDKKFYGVYSQVVLGAEMKMVDVKSSEIIWQADHIEKTHSDSIPLSPFSIPGAVVESSINVRDKVIADTADRLSKKLIESIPSKEFEPSYPADIISIKTIGNTIRVYYRVQAGDTLSIISRKFYGNVSGIRDIRNANLELTGDTLMIGQELIIPNIPFLEHIDEWEEIDRNNYNKFLYRIQWGDSLYEISAKVLKDGKKWTVIYDANKAEVKDIQDLPVGQVIIIPLVAPN